MAVVVVNDEVAVVALPFKLAVIVPAEKLPKASRKTMVLGILVLVAASARPVADATLVAVWPFTKLTTVHLACP